MGISAQSYNVPSSEDVRKIDQNGRWILENVGIQISDSEFLKILDKAGASVDFDSQRVRFDGEWLDETLSNAPSNFILYSRDGRHDVRLGEGKVNFANGGRVFRLFDMGTGGHRSTMLRDVVYTAALVDRLDNIRFYIIACQAHDLKPEFYHLNDFYHSFNNTTKHVMGGCDNFAGVQQVWDLACIVAGGADKLKDRPFLSLITNPISPLTVDSTTLNILRFSCEKGIPVTCAPAPIAGATAPVTLAGTLSQLHAEALAGVALTQVFSPGARVLYGAVATAMDLRTAEFTMGSIEMAIMNGFAVKLAKLYNLPIYASGGTTESKVPDIQAGVEKTFSCLTTAMAGADCVHLAAGMLDSCNTISYEQYVIDNEIIGMVHRLMAGVTINETTLAADVIKNVGPGGNFVAEEHTVNHMMDEFFYPELAVRCNFDLWEERGKPGMLSRAVDVVDRIIEESNEGLLPRDMIAKIEETFPGLQSI